VLVSNKPSLGRLMHRTVWKNDGELIHVSCTSIMNYFMPIIEMPFEDSHATTMMNPNVCWKL